MPDRHKMITRIGEIQSFLSERGHKPQQFNFAKMSDSEIIAAGKKLRKLQDRVKSIIEIAEIQEELRKLGVTEIEFFNFREMSDERILEEGLALRDQLERKKKNYVAPKRKDRD